MKYSYISDCQRGCHKRKNEQNEWDVEMHAGCCKLSVHDWFKDITLPFNPCDIFEIRFKNTHKGFYKNTNELTLQIGDIVTVESASGHDVGIVSLSGPLVLRQMARHNIRLENFEFKKIYRKAKPFDIEKWQEAIAREHRTMIKSRQISAALNLNMKIGDVEFQGDGTKAIFYYIADERVDFRELIKRLAEEFHIRIEMRQIGARQEAGLIGGIGICGRELCCSLWMSGFATVNTTAARWQDLSLNPQKLTGQCSKLKCCLNHEVATYFEAQKDFPRINNPLEATDGSWSLFKTDILKGLMFFITSIDRNEKIVELPIARVKEIISLNKKGVKAPALSEQISVKTEEVKPDFKNTVGEDSITRFDKKKKSRNRNHRHHKNRTNDNSQKSNENNPTK